MSSILHTIGYEGTNIESFLSALQRAGVKRVIDVRAVPVSRKRGFSKKGLSANLKTVGIDYHHFVDLGDPKDGREAARAGRLDDFRSIYERHLTSREALSALDELVRSARSGPACLLCFERDPITCHRSLIANRLRQSEFDVIDLYSDDLGRHVRSDSEMSRSRLRESAAAA